MANRSMISLKQHDHEYHFMTIMITDNPKYLKDTMALVDPDEAIEIISKWIRRSLTSPPRWKKRKEQDDGKKQ